MAKKKEETALAVSVEDLMMPAETQQFDAGDAGAGSEDIQTGDIVLPRISLLQAMSKAVQEEIEGAKAGLYWTTPYNRPASLSAEDGLKFIVVRIFNAQRRWTPLTEGGGIECEAAYGDYQARDAEGLAAAKLKLEVNSKGVVTSLEWVGGRPTSSCEECVYGPGAAASAAGRTPSGRGNSWLPKIIVQDGESIRLENEQRAPRCTASIDVLALVALPPFNGMPPEIVPAFISFSRSSLAAGRSLAGMIKLAAREPAWAKIFTLAAKKTQNDKGIFYVATVAQTGYAVKALTDQARELYESTQDKSYVPDMNDGGDLGETGAASGDVIDAPPSEDEAAPEDSF